MNENKFNEILQELSECREDERNSQNQMLQTIATAASALTLILGVSIFGSDEIIQQSYPLKLSLYLLSFIVFVLTNGRLKHNQYIMKFQKKNVNIQHF